MTTPAIQISDAARRAIREAAEDDRQALRITVSPTFEHELAFDTVAEADVTIDCDGLRVVLDSSSATRADGITIDVSTGPDGPGFTIQNPNEPPRIRQLAVLDLKALLDAGTPLQLVDVRTEDERRLACIEGSRLLDAALHQELLELDRNTVIVFHCHHGYRSQAAAEYFVTQGFRRLFNLAGGIDAWSAMVDPAVARY